MFKKDVELRESRVERGGEDVQNVVNDRCDNMACSSYLIAFDIQHSHELKHQFVQSQRTRHPDVERQCRVVGAHMLERRSGRWFEDEELIGGVFLG